MIFPTHPFGREITTEQIVKTMQGFSGWEDKYRQVVKWGKLLPLISDELKQQQVIVAGCESKVWLHSNFKQQKWHYCIDSDARIVRGLIAIVLAAYEGKSTKEVVAFDIRHYFEELGLIQHLSPSRGNGLNAIVETIVSQARNA